MLKKEAVSYNIEKPVYNIEKPVQVGESEIIAVLKENSELKNFKIKKLEQEINNLKKELQSATAAGNMLAQKPAL